MIRHCVPSDAAAICAIYNDFVRRTIVTFEEEPVTVSAMAERIAGLSSRLPWLVWEQDGRVDGYAYAAPWRSRASYRKSVETTVYVADSAVRRGIGTALYQALIEDLRERGLHAVVGGIALPNPASVALHEKLGFRQVGQLREIGRKLDRWIDVGYWERLLR